MDKTVVSLIGALSALAAAVPAQAATTAPFNMQEAMHAGSYADLLRPIPNASALLKQSESADETTPDGQAVIEKAQYYHHHHHRYYRRHHHHHHHHHHHNY